MGILVTRPEDAGQHLTEMLNKAGVAAIYAPFIKIEAGEQLNDVPQKLQQLAVGDYVISVSQYAVQYAHQVLQNTGFGWRKDVHYFAVGRKTAALLSESKRNNRCIIHLPMKIVRVYWHCRKCKIVTGSVLLFCEGRAVANYYRNSCRNVVQRWKQ